MRMTCPFFSRCAWMAGSQPRNWVVVRSPTRFGSIGSAASRKAIEPSGGPGRSKKKTRLYRRWGIGAWPRWTMRSTGMSATSHAPNDGSADTRQVTPAWASRSWASSTAFVRRPTGNWSPTVLAFRPRMTSSNRSVSAMDPDTDASPQKKLCPRGLPFLLGPLNHEAPRSRQFHAPFAEGLLRVVYVILRRGDREHLRAGFHSRGRADRRPKRGAHAFRDPVRARPRRNLVLSEHVVRIQSEFQVVRVARLLRDVAVRGDPRRLERDVSDLTLLLRDKVDLDREGRAQITDVELANSDSRDDAHVLLAGIRLAPDFPVHASRFARHVGGALERTRDI